ncbi:hypothetical protein FB451DRAFT_1162620 [Mycena latifolia]|nr:hypothetical protein FB451DRAFT_1162620 [Mycena latifolia]
MYALGTRCCHRSPSKWRDFGSIAYRHIGMDMLLAGYAIAATIMTARGLNSLDSWAHHGLVRGPKKQPVQCKIAATAALKSDFFHPCYAWGMVARGHKTQPVEGKNPKKIPCGAGSGSTRWEKHAGSTQSDSSLGAPTPQWMGAPARMGVTL